MAFPYRENPDAFFSALEAIQKPHLEELRRISLSYVPRVNETLKWNQPAYVHDGEMMWMLQAFKSHCSLRFTPVFFIGFQERVLDEGYQFGAGFLKIPYTVAVPESLCRELMQARLDEPS